MEVFIGCLFIKWMILMKYATDFEMSAAGDRSWKMSISLCSKLFLCQEYVTEKKN